MRDISNLVSFTDLAVEAHQMITKKAGPTVPGVESTSERFKFGTIHHTRVINQEGARRLGKPIGDYVTFEVPAMRKRDPDVIASIGEALASELEDMLGLPDDARVLVVGLGNWNVTPDALGPRVVEDLVVTRHLFSYAPETVDNGFRSVAALSPGVMGLTGVETAEIVRGVVEHIQPDCIICVDALAAGSTHRVSTTIQLTNTGINPGSGVGNKRMAITQESMGIPVIAIGVPTVVHAVTIAYDAINVVLNNFARQGADVRSISDFNSYDVINDILQPYVGELVVTPKEADELIDTIASVISDGLNQALHPALTGQEAMTLR